MDTDTVRHVQEILDKCSVCEANLTPQIANTWSPLEIPDKKCDKCGILCVYEEPKT